MNKECPYQLKTHDLPLQRNALRIEAITPSDCCSLMPKVDSFGREYSVVRWVLSGGCPSTASHPCVGSNNSKCPLNNGLE